MLRKKEVYTVITPIPGFIPRQLAIDILQSHSEVITLNPLVIDHKPIPAPRDAAADEFYSTWYEITERVTFVPGIGKMGSSKITFKGVFHDVPGGLQTHIYVPFGIDLRNRYHIGGNQPGVEPPEHRELGLDKLGAPKDGLYLREDIEIRGNISVVGFVKSQLKAASKEMVQRIIRKAELLDAGVLQAMMTQDGKLQTVNPNDRSHKNATPAPGSPTSINHPAPYHQQRAPSASPAMSYARPGSTPSSPGPYHQTFGQQQQQYGQQQQLSPQQQYGQPQQSMTPPPLMPHKEQPTSNAVVMELPGDFQYYGQQSFAAELPSEPVPAPADNKK